VASETDPYDTMEGLYFKVEIDGEVVERYKFVGAIRAAIGKISHWSPTDCGTTSSCLECHRVRQLVS